jgi:hypothetical protein
MKRILLKLLIFVFILLVFDWGYGHVCHYLVNHPNGGGLKLDQYICDSTKANVLIFGSSKAQNQYDPSILEDTLGMSVFNCGYHGMGVIFHYGRWKIISKRYVPKVIVYEVLPIVDMMVRDDNTIFINPLRPYYGKVEGVDSIFWKIDPTEKYKMMANTYQYHSLVDYLSCYKTTAWYRNGYIRSGNSVLNPQTVQYSPFEYALDSVKWYYMEKFVHEVSARTQLIIAVSPMFSFHDDHGGLTKLKELCAKCQVPVLDHFCDPDFVDNPKLYKDMSHLNRTGSEKWSRLISSELKEIMYNEQPNSK